MIDVFVHLNKMINVLLSVRGGPFHIEGWGGYGVFPKKVCFRIQDEKKLVPDYTGNKFSPSSGEKKIVCVRVSRYVDKTLTHETNLHCRSPEIKKLPLNYVREKILSCNSEEICRLEKTMVLP